MRPAKPAAGPGSGAAAEAGARARAALFAGLSAAVLLAVALLAAQLVALRVPEHRAALEQLIRHETGLDVSFRELTVRIGWYGPEAVFHQVRLGEPAPGGALLSAPQLVVGLDTWRTLRSGHLEAARITLLGPDIDLSSAAPAAGAAPGRTRSGDAPQGTLARGLRLLSGWRGGRIDIEGGTLRLPAPPGATPLGFNIRHAQLRRLGARWSASAAVLLPARLGSSARGTLSFEGDPAQPQRARGSFSFEGRRLDFAGWHALALAPPVSPYLPLAGSGSLEVHGQFAAGELQEASGRVQAAGLAWAAPQPGAPRLQLERLRGPWQWVRLGGEWHFSADDVELASDAPAARLSVAAADRGGAARGSARHLPLPVLAALAAWYLPQVPPADALAFQGEARELSFDWNAQRPAGVQLQVTAQLEALTLASLAPQFVLSGLSARVSAVGERLVADVSAAGAQLHLPRAAAPVTIADLGLAARLALEQSGGSWRLTTEDLEVRRAGMRLTAGGSLSGRGASAERVSARLSLRDADAALLAQLIGPEALAALAPAAGRLIGGRIESAELELRAPLDGRAPWNAPGAVFRGALTLRDGHLEGSERWPQTQDLALRLNWRGPKLHAALEGGRSGSFHLAAGRLDWDLGGGLPLRVAARLAGSTSEALGWLRAHPQLLAWTPAVQDLELEGPTLIDLDMTLPPAAHEATAPKGHLSASLEGARLRALQGLPPIEGLRGTLTFANGHLQHSLLSGQWLGGPMSLAVGERREAGAAALAISGRGTLAVREALLAAGAGRQESRLSGSAEWSALLNVGPGPGGTSVWHLRADSTLAGLASHLPEPFAKPAEAALPLRLELHGSGERGELEVSLSEHLRALAALTRDARGWRIDRGAVRLDATPPALPATPVLALEGRVRRLDLPAYLALWHEAAHDAALPPLAAHLSAAQLLAGPRQFPEVTLTADAAQGAGELELSSADLSGTIRWPARISTAEPASARFADFNVADAADSGLAAGLAQLFAPALQLSIEQLAWQGHPLGELSARLSAQGNRLEVSELRLAGPAGEGEARLGCTPARCEGRLSLESRDVAATLAGFGLRPELKSAHGLLAGHLQWSPGAPAAALASLEGDLHMQLEDGAARVAAGDSAAPPFALLSVPALMGGLRPESDESELRFARFTAGFRLRGGEATTSDLHFDGDAEILVRGRVGLLARDYDAEAVILRGEDRLPAAVRRLAASPRVAAAWLSLRELFGGAAAGRGPAVLRLRGSWSDPIVTAAE